jgi:hypothetical protein
MNEAQKRMILGSPRRGLGCRVKVRVMPATVDEWTISRHTKTCSVEKKHKILYRGGYALDRISVLAVLPTLLGVIACTTL